MRFHANLLAHIQYGTGGAMREIARANVFAEWHQQAVRFNQRVEDVLQNVLNVARVTYAPADEVAQPGRLPLDCLGDPPVLVECHPFQARRVLHLRL